MTALIRVRAGRKFAEACRSFACAAADRRGAVAIEFGLVVIPLVLLMMGIFQIGYSYYVAAGGFPDMFKYVGNTLIPQISTNMQNCASAPGNYFSANTPTEIEAAMQNISRGITAYTRLTR